MHKYKEALLDQLALAADRQIELKAACAWWEGQAHLDMERAFAANCSVLPIPEGAVAKISGFDPLWNPRTQTATQFLWQRIKRWWQS